MCVCLCVYVCVSVLCVLLVGANPSLSICQKTLSNLEVNAQPWKLGSQMLVGTLFRDTCWKAQWKKGRLDSGLLPAAKAQGHACVRSSSSRKTHEILNWALLGKE